MAETDGSYFRRRMREELAKAEQAGSLELRHVHETLAGLYRIRLRALSQDQEAA